MGVSELWAIFGTMCSKEPERMFLKKMAAAIPPALDCGQFTRSLRCNVRMAVRGRRKPTEAFVSVKR